MIPGIFRNRWAIKTLCLYLIWLWWHGLFFMLMAHCGFEHEIAWFSVSEVFFQEGSVKKANLTFPLYQLGRNTKCPCAWLWFLSICMRILLPAVCKISDHFHEPEADVRSPLPILTWNKTSQGSPGRTFRDRCLGKQKPTCMEEHCAFWVGCWHISVCLYIPFKVRWMNQPWQTPH